jgi:hypothetical protein
MDNSEEYFHLIGKQIKGATCGKMFGHISYGIGKRPFFFLEGHDVVFKLKDELNKEAMSLKGAKFFDPRALGNKTKSNWVQLPFTQKDHWEFYAKEAFKLVSKETEGIKKTKETKGMKKT